MGQVKNNFIQQLEIGMSDGVRNCTIMIGYSFCIGIRYVLILTLGDLQCWFFNDWRKILHKSNTNNVQKSQIHGLNEL